MTAETQAMLQILSYLHATMLESMQLENNVKSPRNWIKPFLALLYSKNSIRNDISVNNKRNYSIKIFS